jgi:acyl-CoA synthetase (AMP-forming)/AMP-acid ligase II
MSLCEYLNNTNRNRLTKVALRKGIQGPSLTYKSLFEQATRLAHQLPQKTVISMALDNSIENVICFLAIGLAGSIVAPLNPAYSQTEFEFYLKRSPGGIILPFGHVVGEAAGKKVGIPIFRFNEDQTGRVQLHGHRLGQASNLPTVKESDSHLILFTSGTTGEPKSVPLSHSNLVSSVKNIIATYSLTEQDATIAIMPLFHIHGLMASLFATLGSGGTVILPSSGKFASSTFFKELVGNNCTWFTAVPTMHHILLQAKDDRHLISRHKLRFIRSCSSALAPALLTQVEAMYGVEVLEAYAMTEASHQMTSNPLGGSRKSGTVGIPQGSVELKIFNGSGKEVPVGGRGEVCVKGPNVTAGYLNNPTANASAFFGSFFRTGDEGFLDQDGFLTITGRLKELINRGGEKISPIEIDSVLLSHSAVSEAVSFAIPDPKYGEVVGAAVVLKNGARLSEEQLKSFVSTKVTGFKVPVKIFIAQELPRTATGKIQRRLVADKFLRPSKL